MLARITYWEVRREKVHLIRKRGECMYKERMSKVVATAAKGMAKRGVNEACIMWLYQPVIPQSVKQKLSKIK